MFRILFEHVGVNKITSDVDSFRAFAKRCFKVTRFFEVVICRDLGCTRFFSIVLALLSKAKGSMLPPLKLQNRSVLELVQFESTFQTKHPAVVGVSFRGLFSSK